MIDCGVGISDAEIDALLNMEVDSAFGGDDKIAVCCECKFYKDNTTCVSPKRMKKAIKGLEVAWQLIQRNTDEKKGSSTYQFIRASMQDIYDNGVQLPDTEFNHNCYEEKKEE